MREIQPEEYMNRKRILLGDDHVLILDGFRRLLEPYYEIVGEATDGRALTQMAVLLRPDLVIADIAMPLLNGIEAARHIRKNLRQTKILFVTMHSNPLYVLEAASVGASGVVLKTSARQELLAAVKEIFLGHWYVTPGFGAEPGQTAESSVLPSAIKELSAREREVLQLIAEGHSTKEMAAILCISCKTVSFHKQNIKEKLGMRRDAELVTEAIRQGLVSV